MQTGAFNNFPKKSSLALTQNDNIRRFSRDIDVNENNLIDMKFNIMNKSEGNNLLFLRQNQRTKTQRSKLSSNLKMELLELVNSYSEDQNEELKSSFIDNIKFEPLKYDIQYENPKYTNENKKVRNFSNFSDTY